MATGRPGSGVHIHSGRSGFKGLNSQLSIIIQQSRVGPNYISLVLICGNAEHTLVNSADKDCRNLCTLLLPTSRLLLRHFLMCPFYFCHKYLYYFVSDCCVCLRQVVEECKRTIAVTPNVPFVVCELKALSNSKVRTHISPASIHMPLLMWMYTHVQLKMLK